MINSLAMLKRRSHLKIVPFGRIKGGYLTDRMKFIVMISAIAFNLTEITGE
ncbi:MAG: hypothetical protein ACOC04_04815 [Halothece sp.]